MSLPYWLQMKQNQQVKYQSPPTAGGSLRVVHLECQSCQSPQHLHQAALACDIKNRHSNTVLDKVTHRYTHKQNVYISVKFLFHLYNTNNNTTTNNTTITFNNNNSTTQMHICPTFCLQLLDKCIFVCLLTHVLLSHPHCFFVFLYMTPSHWVFDFR